LCLRRAPGVARLVGMNNAQIKGLQLTHDDYKRAAAAEVSRCTITRTSAGYEARRGGSLVGVTLTREGAKELLGAL